MCSILSSRTDNRQATSESVNRTLASVRLTCGMAYSTLA
jgi:hypothetical protein